MFSTHGHKWPEPQNLQSHPSKVHHGERIVTAATPTNVSNIFSFLLCKVLIPETKTLAKKKRN
jgi:hypothetical protein